MRRTTAPVILSPEQQFAFNKFKNGENLFITGPGGTGKSKLIHMFVDHMKSVGIRYQVCAMTGCAAVLLQCGARTIHSWSGIRLGKGPEDSIVDFVRKKSYLCNTWKNTDILIIDEVSMMSAKIFNVLEKIARVTRVNPAPFGGMQVIFVGDFFQLPPVFDRAEEETESQFCFQSVRWETVFKPENCVQLNTIFRQNDSPYISVLNEVRQGSISEPNVEILMERLNREYNAEENGGIVPTKIFPIRSKVDSVNKIMFEQLEGEVHEFEIIHIKNMSKYLENGKSIPLKDRLRGEQMTEEDRNREIDTMENNTMCPKKLALKVGATVMCTANIDMENGICNGAQGIIIDFAQAPPAESEMESFVEIPVVKFINGVVKRINAHYWQSENHPNIVIGQIPLTLAWAVTIHKIQGATMQLAEIDIGSRIFEYGQTYVALSRIKSLDGLYLSSFQPEKIKANPLVIAFYESLPKTLINPLVSEKPVSGLIVSQNAPSEMQRVNTTHIKPSSTAETNNKHENTKKIVISSDDAIGTQFKRVSNRLKVSKNNA